MGKRRDVVQESRPPRNGRAGHRNSYAWNLELGCEECEEDGGGDQRAN